MSAYDKIFKHIAGEFPRDIAVLALKTSEVEVTDRLNTEHITIKTHQSDMIYQVRLPDEEAILHIEAQTDDSTYKPMHLRMLAYSSVLYLEYEKNVYSTVLYFRPPAGRNDPGFYEYGNEDRGGGVFRYNVIRIYELEGAAFLDPAVLGVLPFTALMDPPSDMTRNAWTEKCIETIRTVDVDVKMRGTLLFALSLFGSFVQSTELFKDASLEAIMQQSPFYDHVIQRGIEQGDEQGYRRGIEQGIEQGDEQGYRRGIEQGIEQGERNNTVESILELLSIRFTIDTTEAIKSDIESIDSLERLKQLRRAAAEVRDFAAFMHILQNGAEYDRTAFKESSP